MNNIKYYIFGNNIKPPLFFILKFIIFLEGANFLFWFLFS